RNQPPVEIGGLSLRDVNDYLTHEVRSLNAGSAPQPLPHPSGDLLIFHAARPGCRFAVRPSGTEPKMKVYIFARTDVAHPRHLPAAKQETAQLLDQVSKDLGEFIDRAARSAS